MNRIMARLGVVLAVMVGALGMATVPAQADTSQEIQSGCGWHISSLWEPGTYYQYNPNGASVIIERTGSFQVAGSSSQCEDINLAPSASYPTDLINVYARTYMCSLSNPSNCWYNAWRYCGGGCAVATNMSAGVWYFVEIGNLGHPGGTNQVYLYD
jgi:hypothetical protein